MHLSQDFLDTAIYIKGDRQDSAKIYDIQLEIEYFTDDLFLINDTGYEIVGAGAPRDFGTSDVSEDGSSLTVADNGWKMAMRDTTITSETVISFDFEATEEAEIYAISFGSWDSSDSPQTYTFQIGGSKIWGKQAFNT
ncbi:hypothetical protein [Jannaschia seohaensis]|nr:hypothetical protein [Jannaschia seohaensis]